MDIKIKSKHYTLIALVIVFLLFGAIIGYVVNKSANVEEPVVTPPATPVIYETAAATTATPDTVETTVAPTPTQVAPTATPPQVPDFTHKAYDPAVDKETRTIEFRNNDARPYTISIRPGDSVLFKITDTTSTGQSIFTLVITSGNRSEKINIGKSGAMTLFTFNNTGTYTFQAIIEADDPTINPRKYGNEGKIAVY